MMLDNPTLSPLTITVSGLSKHYPGVVALDDVSLEFLGGSVTAVVGENGAGKSTLMGVIAGLTRPDGGTVRIGEHTVTSFSPHELLHRHGVALVPQEIALCFERSVAENVMLGQEGARPTRRAMIAQTRAVLEQMQSEIDPRRRVGSLSVAEQQLVLIARALTRRCRVLILDEPTTSLTANEVNRLFALLKRLRESGTTVIYVSHRMPEVFELSDRIHVLRDGRHVASHQTDAITADTLVSAMVGRDIAQRTVNIDHALGAPVLDVVDLHAKHVNGVTLQARAGEIVGVAGLPDSGRSELVAALFGALKTTGTVRIDGTQVRLRSPRDGLRAGLGYVPAERRAQGLFPDMSIADNAIILDIDAATRFGVVSGRRLRRTAHQRLAEDDVRGNTAGKITALSGGNQQKVVLGRWLARNPRVLLLDDPTRGIDVGAKADIHERLAEAARRGTTIVMASSDLPELLRTCHRIAVMSRGRVAGEVAAATATEQQVMALATETADRTSIQGEPT